MLSKAVVIHQILRLEFLCIGRQQTRVSLQNGQPSFAYNFNPKGRFMVCLEHFNEVCLKRLFHKKGNVRRLNQDPFLLCGESLKNPPISRSCIGAVIRHAYSAEIILFF